MHLKIEELLLYVTNKCNLKCKHCFVPKEKEHKELPIQDLKWIKDNIEAKKTILVGGEPLLYKHLDKLLQDFPNVTISTNAQLINDKNIKKIKEAKATVQISVEGGETETNEIRGQNVWDKCISAAKKLKEADVPFAFRTSYWQANLDGIEEVMHLGEKFDAQVILFPRVDKQSLDAANQRDLFDNVINHEKCLIAQPNFFQYCGKKNGRCHAGDGRLSVFWDGKITPCHLDLDYYLGKIGDNIENIQRNAQVFVKSFKTAPIGCAGCKHLDVCKGGCYVTQSSFDCPLKYNVDVGDFIVRTHADKEKIMGKIEMMTAFIKSKQGVC